MRHTFQFAADAIKTAEERTGEKFTLLPCPHCGHHANLCDPQKDPDTWGGYRWEIVCSSSHCRARVSIVADGWFEQVDMKLNPGFPSNGYGDRVTTLRAKWNRRINPYSDEQRPPGSIIDPKNVPASAAWAAEMRATDEQKSDAK